MMSMEVLEGSVLPCRKRKTRRGKKRLSKIMTFDNMESWSCGCATSEDGRFDSDAAVLATIDGSTASSAIDSDVMMKNSKAHKHDKKRIRPYNSPRAPHNSTQFIMEDRLAVKSETSHRSNKVKVQISDNFEIYPHDRFSLAPIPEAELDVEQCLSPTMFPPASTWSTSPAYSDVDYEYKSIDDLGMLTFQEQDFERAFQDAKEQELDDKSKTELIDGIQQLECLVEELRADLKSLQPKRSVEPNSDDLTRLKAELAQLQIENVCLKNENQRLAAGGS